MYYKISKFLTIGLLSCSVQFMDSLSASNVSEENNNQIVYNNTTNVNNYSFNIPTYYEKEVSAEEVKEFLENLRTNPSALVNAKFQLYSLKDYILPDVLKRLDAYLTELSCFRSTDLDYSYQVKISNSPNDLSIKFVALINQYLDNVISPVSKHYKEMPDRAYFERDVWECYCTVITKIIRGVNLVSSLMKKKQKVVSCERNKLKNKQVANILTLSNNNCKCWFMSVFQLFVTALNQSAQNDPIRKTNFAQFVSHLRNMQIDFSRSVKTQQNEIELYKRKVYNDWNYFKQSKEWEYRNVMNDRTGKSNVIGDRIDLISELILWCSNQQNNDWYNGKITSVEQKRRDEAIELLQTLQDINSGSFQINAVIIILNLFPELKQLFGSFYNPDYSQKFSDALLYAVDGKNNEDNYIFVMDNNKMKEEASINYDHNNKIPKLSSFTPEGHYLNEINPGTQSIMVSYEYENVFNSSQYVLMPGSYSNNMFITKYNSNNRLEIYELIGIGLSNKDHAVCFVKTGKSDSSWSGIDSNCEANDDGYTLDDIKYKLGNENTYLAKVYNNKNDMSDGSNPYKQELSLYKRVLQNDISGEIN